jgi:predicted nucleotidyltransferase component of viral defense system
MISETQLEELSQYFKIDKFTIFREYLQILFLNYFYREKLSEKIYFKGGTCLHLFYNSPRFSEDLDFSTTLSFKTIKELLNKTMKALKIEIPELSLNFLYQGKNSLRFKIKYQGKLFKYPLTIRLDFAFEKIFLEPNILSLKTKFPIVPVSLISCEKEEEILTEKIRAFLWRKKGRDIFDLWYLLEKGTLINRELLDKKLKIINLNFDEDNFLKKIKKYSEKKIYLDLSKFLPSNYRKIIPQLKERLILMLSKSSNK